jgi:NAD(P)-dependent dehydrogenase (short-subunit alcohol dehydrogenase family)
VERRCLQHTDVTSEPDIKALVDRAVREYGRLDVMFNNAGLGGAVGPIEAINADDWDRTIAVLLRAVFLGIKYAVAPMRKTGGGSIISTSSVASFLPAPNGAAYAAAKGAVISLTRAAACPGAINTPIWGVDPDRTEQALDNLQPIPRVGRPEDIASMVLYLASDESQWVTGTAMIVDGGLTVGPSFPYWSRSTPGDQPPILTSGFSGPSFQR